MATKLVIIGGVAGGASAAARARRIDERAEIILFERGEYISFANCGLPYYIGGEITEREDLLVATPKLLRDRFRIDVRTSQEVLSIDTAAKTLEIKNHATGETYIESYDKLILSPGAAPVRPPLPGIELDSIHTLRDIPDTDRIKARVVDQKPENAVIVGGGFIGLEMAESLTGAGVRVTVVEMLDQVMAPIDFEMAAIVHEHLRSKGVELRLKKAVKSFRKNGAKTVVTLDDGGEISCDMVILSIGVRPEAALAKKSGLELGARGGIKTDEFLRTSDPDIYAVGDAVEVTDFISGKPVLIPLAGPANKQGRIAAENALGRNRPYSGTQGTAIVRVFDLAVAATGANEKTLKRENIPYIASHTHSASHAGYFPGAQQLAVKLLFSPDGGKVLGAQIVGGDGVDKRIDVIATAIRAGMTAFDLEELELAYAPPYGSAKDAVNIAGFTAANILRGDVKIKTWDEADTLDTEKFKFIDLRNKPEIDASSLIGNAVHVPLHELRGRLGELDKSKSYVAYCAVGLRGYIGTRIMSQNGFDVYNLGGGYRTWSVPVRERKLIEHPGAGSEDVKKNNVNGKPPTPADGARPDFEVNACGAQCPGPIMKLKKKIDEMLPGQTVKISATDGGFARDIPAWCNVTCNELLYISSKGGIHAALIRKGKPGACGIAAVPENRDKTFVIFSNDFDRALAAFIIANGAAAMGSKVTLFFTFWGLNILRAKGTGVKKDIVSSMFGMMMPKGARELTLSKMNMGGMGTKMMKMVMKQKNVHSLDELIASAREQGVRFVACSMSMEIMGIKKEELIDGVEIGGVADFLASADKGNMAMFI